MTREEAIKHLKSSLRVTYTDETRQALVMGIEALEHPQIVRCKDCRFAHLTYDGLCKQCEQATDDDDIMLTLYLPGDFYCAFGERKDGDPNG